MSLSVSDILLNADTFRRVYPSWPHPEPEERPMAKRVIEADESAMFNATAPLGHDMAPSRRQWVDFSWECQSCGRMAYQEGGHTWGTATDVMCDEPDDEDFDG